VPHHGIQDRQQFSHARGDGNFEDLACRAEAGIEGAQDGIVLDADQGSHRARGPHRGSAAPDETFAPHLAAGVPAQTVVGDAGYGEQPSFLDGLEGRGVAYLVAVPSAVGFRLAAAVAADPGDQPVPDQGHGRPRKGPALAMRLPSQAAA